MAKKVPANNEDKKRSYYKYYLQDCAAGDPERHKLIDAGPGDPANALLIDNRNDLFLPGDLHGEVGWFQMSDGTGLIANKTFFPGVDGVMFDWWFAWHPIHRLRYACWDNEDHYDVYLDDPAKALDLSKSMRERHWGSIHNIWEDIGTGKADLLRIHFRKPSELGYDESKVDTEVCNALVCANVQVIGDDTMPDVPVVMTHFLRPCEGGSILRSRFWFGWQIIDGKAVKCIPDGVQIPAQAMVNLLHHNVKEFSNLSRILPALYAEEKDNWLD